MLLNISVPGRTFRIGDPLIELQSLLQMLRRLEDDQRTTVKECRVILVDRGAHLHPS